eukprot:5320229-Ditylum_brightwellii.AAC.1
MPHILINKKLDPKTGHVPVKQAEENSWDTLCVDLMGPYIINGKGKHKKEKKEKDLTLWCVTMIDPVASWFEIAEIQTKGQIQCPML